MEGFTSKVEKVLAAGVVAAGMTAEAPAAEVDQYTKEVVMKEAQAALNAQMVENEDGSFSMTTDGVEVRIIIDKTKVQLHEKTVTVPLHEEKVTIPLRENTVQVDAPKL